MKAYIIGRSGMVVIGRTAYEMNTGKSWIISTKGVRRWPFIEVIENSWAAAWAAVDEFKREEKRKHPYSY